VAGVGKSTVAYELSRQLAKANVAHAVVEGDNLDQAYPEPWRNGIPLAEKYLAAIWRNYPEAGYHRLIYTNTVSVMEMEEFGCALGGEVRVAGVLLQASDGTTADRLSKRESGASLQEHLERSRRANEYLGAAAPDSVHRVITDGRTPEEVAGDLLALIQWAASGPES